MKKALIVIALCLFGSLSFAQSLTEFYGGVGCATKHNYNVAPTFGFSRLKRLGGDGRLYFGPQVFWQAYYLYIDNEAFSAKKGTGYTGMTESITSSYTYAGIKFSYGLDKSEKLKLYTTASVGILTWVTLNDNKIIGYDSVHKWDHTPGAAQYDSIIDNSMNQNSFQLRLGVGLTKYADLGSKWFMTFTADLSFISNDLTKTGTISDPSRTAYTKQETRPGYISAIIGIGHKGKQKRKR